MNSELVGVWKHIQDLALCALSHANYHAGLCSPENSRWADLSITQAAHAGELLIKARIAQEHPLLIFEQFPSSRTASGEHLSLEDLFKNGKTIQWSDLPERLWATTGISLQGESRFKEFGKLRNQIQHFSSPQNLDFSDETFKFIYEVLDPFINDAWELYAIDYNEDYEPYKYLVENLISREICFFISPEAAIDFEQCDIEWQLLDKKYAELMQTRIAEALLI